MSDPILRNSVTPYILDNPVGIDIVAKGIQASMSELSWNEASFNRAETMTRISQDGEIEVFPKLWTQGGSDEINAIGLDRFHAYSFMHTLDDAEIIGEYNRGDNRYSQELNLYFWFDLKRIDNSKTYDFYPELVQEIKQKLNATYIDGEFQIVNTVTNPEDVYSDFSIDITETQSIHYPYRSVKFVLDCIFYDLECP
jgi:hypothetical protein